MMDCGNCLYSMFSRYSFLDLCVLVYGDLVVGVTGSSA